MFQHTITRTPPQKKGGSENLGRLPPLLLEEIAGEPKTSAAQARAAVPPRFVLPHTSSLSATDSCDELFRDIATRVTQLAEDSLAGTDECEQAERQAASGFHCVALLARLQESVELKDQLLMRLKNDLLALQ